MPQSPVTGAELSMLLSVRPLTPIPRFKNLKTSKVQMLGFFKKKNPKNPDFRLTATADK